MQGSSYPTLSVIVPWCLNLIVRLKKIQRPRGTSEIIADVCKAAIEKLDEYHTAATNQVLSHSHVAMILDARMNLRGLDNVIPDVEGVH